MPLAPKNRTHNVEYDTLKFEVKRPEKHLKTHMWFSKDHDYLPVQLAHFSNGNKKFNAKLKKFTILKE